MQEIDVILLHVVVILNRRKRISMSNNMPPFWPYRANRFKYLNPFHFQTGNESCCSNKWQEWIELILTELDWKQKDEPPFLMEKFIDLCEVHLDELESIDSTIDHHFECQLYLFSIFPLSGFRSRSRLCVKMLFSLWSRRFHFLWLWNSSNPWKPFPRPVWYHLCKWNQGNCNCRCLRCIYQKQQYQNHNQRLDLGLDAIITACQISVSSIEIHYHMQPLKWNHDDRLRDRKTGTFDRIFSKWAFKKRVIGKHFVILVYDVIMKLSDGFKIMRFGFQEIALLQQISNRGCSAEKQTTYFVHSISSILDERIPE
jgi:hypothetical protein